MSAMPTQHYYGVLELPLFCEDITLIERNTRNRMRSLKKREPEGPHITQLMREVAAARACLIAPDRKADYDAKLAQRLAIARPEPIRGNIRLPTAASNAARQAVTRAELARADARTLATSFREVCRAHLLEWRLDEQEILLLVAQATDRGLSEAQAREIVQAAEADAERAAAKRSGMPTWASVLIKSTAAAVAIIAIVVAGMFGRQLWMARQSDDEFSRLVTEIVRKMDNGYLRAAADLHRRAVEARPHDGGLAELWRQLEGHHLAQVEQLLEDRKWADAAMAAKPLTPGVYEPAPEQRVKLKAREIAERAEREFEAYGLRSPTSASRGDPNGLANALTRLDEIERQLTDAATLCPENPPGNELQKAVSNARAEVLAAQRERAQRVRQLAERGDASKNLVRDAIENHDFDLALRAIEDLKKQFRDDPALAKWVEQEALPKLGARLRIDGPPAGTVIRIKSGGGVTTGEAEREICGLQAGRYTVSVEVDGCFPWRIELDLRRGELVQRRADLVPFAEPFVWASAMVDDAVTRTFVCRYLLESEKNVVTPRSRDQLTLFKTAADKQLVSGPAGTPLMRTLKLASGETVLAESKTAGVNGAWVVQAYGSKHTWVVQPDEIISDTPCTETEVVQAIRTAHFDALKAASTSTEAMEAVRELGRSARYFPIATRQALDVLGDPLDRCLRILGMACPNCIGASQLECETCHGRGKIEDWKPCDVCHGQGEIACTSKKCHGGNVDCSRCKGSGMIKQKKIIDQRIVIIQKECKLCEHTGQRKCGACQGDGRTRCPHCLQKKGMIVKFMDCAECDSGRIGCNRCQATGQRSELDGEYRLACEDAVAKGRVVERSEVQK